jgi:hypothetical protein
MLNLAKLFIFRQFSTYYDPSSNWQILGKDKLHPWLVTGLIDGEGCFNISISQSFTKSNLGWEVQARIILELHVKDLALIQELQSFFGGIGTIETTARKARISIVGITDIINWVLPHFSNFPLQSVKIIDFELWRTCVIIKGNKGHLTIEGLKQIFSLKAALNKGLSEYLNSAYSDLASVVRPKYKPSLTSLHPFWISGFVSGEGSFHV